SGACVCLSSARQACPGNNLLSNDWRAYDSISLSSNHLGSDGLARMGRTRKGQMTTTTTRTGYFARLAAERPDVALCRASALIARAADEHAAAQGLGVGQHLVLK